MSGVVVTVEATDIIHEKLNNQFVLLPLLYP
jgi:hypothetical protein